jgi:hypothetical protein
LLESLQLPSLSVDHVPLSLKPDWANAPNAIAVKARAITFRRIGIVIFGV